MSGWDGRQVKMFAKQIADQYGDAWFMLAPNARNALISHHVLMVVFTQRHGTVEIDDVRELRISIEERLGAHHNLRVHP